MLTNYSVMIWLNSMVQGLLQQIILIQKVLCYYGSWDLITITKPHHLHISCATWFYFIVYFLWDPFCIILPSKSRCLKWSLEIYQPKFCIHFLFSNAYFISIPSSLVLFILGSFNSAFSSSDYAVSNDRMNSIGRRLQSMKLFV